MLPNDVMTTLFLLQAVWGLFLIILTWAMKRILSDIEENTRATHKVAESVTAINVMLSGNYTTKVEFERIETRLRDAEIKITRLDARLERRPA